MRIVPDLLCTTAFRTVIFATCCCCPSSIPYQVDLGNPDREIRHWRMYVYVGSQTVLGVIVLFKPTRFRSLSYSTSHPTYSHSKFSLVLMSPISDDYSGTHPIFRVVCIYHFSVCHLVHTSPPGSQLRLLS